MQNVPINKSGILTLINSQAFTPAPTSALFPDPVLCYINELFKQLSVLQRLNNIETLKKLGKKTKIKLFINS